MKPELIFINEKDGMVTMPKEELERIVEKAYQAGKADGSYITTAPYTPTWGTINVPTTDKTTITCACSAGRQDCTRVNDALVTQTGVEG